MHALNRDVNGLLIYTKTKLDSTDSIEVNDGQGFGYNGFEGLALVALQMEQRFKIHYKVILTRIQMNTTKQMQNLESINKSDLIR